MVKIRRVLPLISVPLQETVLEGGTIIIGYDEDFLARNGIPPNGISIPVRNPKKSVIEAAKMLKTAGFTASIKENVFPQVGDKFVMLESNAFHGWVLVFRRHILLMGENRQIGCKLLK